MIRSRNLARRWAPPSALAVIALAATAVCVMAGPATAQPAGRASALSYTAAAAVPGTNHQLAGGASALSYTAAAAVPDTNYPTCGGTSLVPPAPDPNVRVRVPTTADGTRDINCILQEGDVGVPVARLQIGLNECNTVAGFAPLTADGVFGSLTLNAVKKTQAYRGVTADGIVGPQTISAMEWRITVLPGPPFACDPVGG